MVSSLPWEKIYHLLLTSGQIKSPKELSIDVTKKIYSLIPYDQARIYFINDNGKIYDEVLFGADKYWSRAYLEYFSQIENGRYGISPHSIFTQNHTKINAQDWTAVEHNEFVTDYIKPQGLNYSLGFALHDANNLHKCVCAFDRTEQGGYSEHEVQIMRIIQGHLDNLHQNLFVLSLTNNVNRKQIEEKNSLTRRESEIAGLLCNGVTPVNISKKLSLSLSTVYKHIANMHSKLQVSSRQELIVKLLQQTVGVTAT